MLEPQVQRAHRILVIDDDDDIRLGIAELFETEGYIVDAAANGSEAIRSLRASATRKRPCLVLLDLMMPIMDGFEFRRRQLQSEDLAAIPVAVMTAADRRLCAKASQLAFYAVLRKPLSIDELLDLASACCGAGPC